MDVGGTKCAVSLADETPRFLKRYELATGSYNGPDAVLEQLTRWARKLSEKALETTGRYPLSVGISSGGPLSRESGRILSPPNLPGWDDVPIVEGFREALGIPAFLENDANAGALAEWQFGAGRGASNVIFLTFGTGMGAGIILDGRLYRGTSDLAGEVGHIRLSEEGPVGYGKAGSFEGLCSGGGIGRQGVAAAKRLKSQGRSCAFCSDMSRIEEISAKDVTEAANAGDPTAQAIVEDAARYLGRGLALLADLLNPQRIIIGSVYTRNEELFRERAMEELKREALAGAADVCTVLPAELRDHIGDYAALAAARYGIDESEEA